MGEIVTPSRTSQRQRSKSRNLERRADRRLREVSIKTAKLRRLLRDQSGKSSDGRVCGTVSQTRAPEKEDSKIGAQNLWITPGILD